MFRSLDRQEAARRSRRIADWLASHHVHRQHDRHLGRDVVEQRGVLVQRLEEDQVLQDLVLSVFHATTHTFSQTGAVKIIENERGVAFIQQIRQVAVSIQPQQGVGEAGDPSGDEAQVDPSVDDA